MEPGTGTEPQTEPQTPLIDPVVLHRVDTEPITEGIDFVIDAASKNADRKRLQELVGMAEDRCPAIYSMTHVIKVNARLA